MRHITRRNIMKMSPEFLETTKAQTIREITKQQELIEDLKKRIQSLYNEGKNPSYERGQMYVAMTAIGDLKAKLQDIRDAQLAF